MCVLPVVVVVAQTNLIGTTGNLLGNKTKFVVSDRISGITLEIKKYGRVTEIVSESNKYVLYKEQGYTIKDSVDNEVLKVSKNGKCFYLPNHELLQVRKCKGWNFCLVDKDGRMVARGKYSFTGDSAKIQISIDNYYPPLVGAIAFRLVMESKKLAESNSWLLIMASFI